MDKQFHIGDVLSVTSDKLVSPRGMEGIYDILNYMTGESLYTHALIRAAHVCAPYICLLHPELEDIKVPEWVNSKETVNRWLDETVIPKYGLYINIQPLPEGFWEKIDPITELQNILEHN